MPQNIHRHLPPLSVTQAAQSQAANPISSRISALPAPLTSWALRQGDLQEPGVGTDTSPTGLSQAQTPRSRWCGPRGLSQGMLLAGGGPLDHRAFAQTNQAGSNDSRPAAAATPALRHQNHQMAVGHSPELPNLAPARLVKGAVWRTFLGLPQAWGHWPVVVATVTQGCLLGLEATLPSSGPTSWPRDRLQLPHHKMEGKCSISGSHPYLSRIRVRVVPTKPGTVRYC